MNDFTSDDGRDDFILQERLSGKSARAVSKQLRCTVGEVNAALDRTLPILDNAARLRHISLDLSRLDELLKVFFALAIEKEDAEAGLLCVKIMERKSALLGLDQPVKLDVISVQAQQAPSSYDRIKRAIEGLVEQASPAQKALRKRLEQLDPETVLALLNTGNGSGGPADGNSGEAS